MLRTGWNKFLMVALLFSSAACTQPIVQRESSTQSMTTSPSSVTDNRSLLAGEWEYEDGAVVMLTLDEQGNGAYAWKDGRFETTALTDHTWQGKWFQKENDREGGFIVKFSPEFSDGDGRWWYSRIGDDQAPTQEGGTFHLSRKSSSTAAAKTLPVH